MVDKTLEQLDAVSAPVVTDILGTRQVADSEDRRYTRAQLRQLLAGEQLDGTDAASAAVLNEAATATNPTLVPNKGDLTSGEGSVAAGSTSRIVNSVEASRMTELNGQVLEKVDVEQGITAFATGGQTNATLLKSSYNLIETVVTKGDSVKLPEVFEVGTIVRVKMLFGGPFECDIFPFLGDDLGRGTNNPIRLNIHKSLTFIGLVANTTWDLLYDDNNIGFTIAITAFAGGGQGSAVELTTKFNRVSAIATNGDSVRLPTVHKIGDEIVIANFDSAQSLDVFPASGDNLGAGANNAQSLKFGATVSYVSAGGLVWHRFWNTVEV